MTNTHDGSPPARTRPAEALSRAIGLSDWDDERLVALMEAIAPNTDPTRRPHRKAWEFAIGVLALEEAGLLDDPDGSMGLSVGAGHEAVLYYLTTRCRWLIATDLYGVGDFAHGEAGAMMLTDPDLFAPYPYRRRRLTTVHMDALDLRFEDKTFDYLVSFGSIEHFGGHESAARALSEAGRVLRPGGVAVITTEMAIDGGGDLSLSGLELFSPETLLEMVEREPLLDWFGPVELTPPDPDGAPLIDLHGEVERVEAGDQTYPHIRLSVRGPDGPRAFSSVSLALTRSESP